MPPLGLKGSIGEPKPQLTEGFRRLTSETPLPQKAPCTPRDPSALRKALKVSDATEWLVKSKLRLV